MPGVAPAAGASRIADVGALMYWRHRTHAGSGYRPVAVCFLSTLPNGHGSSRRRKNSSSPRMATVSRCRTLGSGFRSYLNSGPIEKRSPGPMSSPSGVITPYKAIS